MKKTTSNRTKQPAQAKHIAEYLNSGDARLERILTILAKDCAMFHSNLELNQESIVAAIKKSFDVVEDDLEKGIGVTIEAGKVIDFTIPDNIIDEKDLDCPYEIRYIVPNHNIRTHMRKLAEAGEAMGWNLSSDWKETKDIIEAYS